MRKFNLWTILVIYFFLLLLVLVIEIYDQIMPGSLPFPFHFWEAMAAVGTIGAVFVALVVPLIKSVERKKENKEQSLLNIKNEIFILFDQLSYNNLNRRDFTLSYKQLGVLLDNPYQVNIQAEGIFRKLKMLHDSVRWFNVRMELFVNRYNSWGNQEGENKLEEVEKKQIWLQIKRDSIKLMLIIFWVAGIIDFEKEGEDSIRAINDFLAVGDHLNTSVFDKLKKGLITEEF